MKKLFTILASFLIFIGIVITAIGMAGINFDFSKLNSAKFTQKNCDITESFTDINIQTIQSDVEIYLSVDGKCRIESNVLKNISQEITVEGNTLNIIQEDKRKWYEMIGVFWGDESIKVYLPETEFQKLNIISNTGKCNISKDFSFSNVIISTDTGDVDFLSNASELIDIETATGRISLSDINTKGIDLETDTGRIEISNAKCGNIKAQSYTGSIKLNNVIADKDLKIESDTGDVNLISCDADSIDIETDTGDVSGTLRSQKVFITETDTGYISVPKTVSGGKCEITTDTGNIKIEIK